MELSEESAASLIEAPRGGPIPGIDPEPPFESDCFEARQMNVERLRCAYSGSFILRRSAL
jgi:hypothetical protein